MWFIYDSCGIACCIATYCIMIFVSTIVTKVSIIPLSSENYLDKTAFIIIYVLLLTLAGISHLRCMLTDPGAIPKNSYDMNIEDFSKSSPQTCLRCNCLKTPKTHHCSICERCISKMDHHCPWINNCVGMYTQKFFLLFLFYIMLACIYSFILLILRASFCVGHKKSDLCKEGSYQVTLDLILGVISGFVNALFLLFVTLMLYDQITCIINNTSGIDILKNSSIEKRSVRVNFEETFGGRCSIFWLLPTAVKPPLSQTNISIDIS